MQFPALSLGLVADMVKYNHAFMVCRVSTNVQHLISVLIGEPCMGQPISETDQNWVKSVEAHIKYNV